MLASPLLDTTGRTCWLVSAEDDERKSASTLSQMMFEPFVVGSPIGVAVLDTDLRYVWVNDALEYGGAIPRARRLGLHIAEAVPHVDVRGVETRVRRVLESGVPILDYEFRGRVPTKDSREYVYRMSFFRLEDQAGRVHGVWYITSDITDRWRARERLVLLNEASARIGSTLDVTRTAQELADVAVPRLADFAAIDLLYTVPEGVEPAPGRADDIPDMYRAAMRSVSGDYPEARVRIGEAIRHPLGSLAARTLAEDRAVLETVTAASAAEDPWSKVGALRPHSVMAVPLRARGVTLGVVCFARWRSPDRFEEDDVLLAEELVARAGVCVDNARRFTREQTAATVLQRSLMPRVLFERPALEVASRYLPAVASHGLGSDWFDMIPLSGARVALVVGDVVGHGYHAAVAMGRIRTTVHMLATLEVPAEEVLAHLDDFVLELQGTEDAVGGDETQTVAAAATGATCLYVVYDPVSRCCTMARAGHLPPAVVSPDGAVSFPDLAAGPPLGLGALPFESAEFELPEGSVLALYTDGLVRTRDQDIDEGMARLAAVLAEHDTHPEGICDAVISALVSGPLSDDVALLVARTHALGLGLVVTWDMPSDPAAVAGARRLVHDQLVSWGLEDLFFTTELIVSELITNAMRYGGGPIRLRLILDDALICEVSDSSNTSPRLRHARTTDEGGRGLFLVAHLSRRWGTRYTGAGKIIWAEQNLPSADTTAS